MAKYWRIIHGYVHWSIKSCLVSDTDTKIILEQFGVSSLYSALTTQEINETVEWVKQDAATNLILPQMET